jgi:hypothetical protein
MPDGKLLEQLVRPADTCTVYPTYIYQNWIPSNVTQAQPTCDRIRHSTRYGLALGLGMVMPRP